MPSRIFRISIRVFLLSIPFVLGCERAPPLQPIGGDVRPTLSSIQVNVFDRTCAVPSCHVGGTAPRGLELSAGQAFGKTVNVPAEERPTLFRIEPGNPDSSYLVLKIEGAPGIVGGRMPLGRPALSAGEIGAIRQWIAAGAPLQ